MRTIFVAALSTVLLASAAFAPTAIAEEVTLSAPHSGATLHSKDVALSVYYTPITATDFEVVVTYLAESQPDQPRRIVMALSYGDRVSFGLPEHPGTLYEFAHKGNAVTVSVGANSGA